MLSTKESLNYYKSSQVFFQGSIASIRWSLGFFYHFSPNRRFVSDAILYVFDFSKKCSIAIVDTGYFVSSLVFYFHALVIYCLFCTVSSICYDDTSSRLHTSYQIHFFSIRSLAFTMFWYCVGQIFIKQPICCITSQHLKLMWYSFFCQYFQKHNFATRSCFFSSNF